MNIFVDYGEKAKFLIKLLIIMVAIQFIVIILLSLNFTKRSIVYINPSAIVGKTQIGYVPDEYAEHVALLFINYLGNFSPLTVKKQFYNAYVLQSPSLQAKTLNTLKEEANSAESGGIIVQTTPVKTEIKKENNIYKVTVTAHRVSIVSGYVISNKEVEYVIKLKPASPTKENYLGMEVIDYEYKIVRDIKDNNPGLNNSNKQ